MKTNNLLAALIVAGVSGMITAGLMHKPFALMIGGMSLAVLASSLYFARCVAAKTAKKRLHQDLHPDFAATWLLSGAGVYEPTRAPGVYRNWTQLPTRADVLKQVVDTDGFGATFFDNPAAMVISSQKGGVIREINHAFEELTGYSRSELVNKTNEELRLYATGQREAFLKRIQHSGGLRNEEHTLRTKSGVQKPVLYSLVPLSIKNEACFLITLMDVTAWKVSEQKYRMIFDNAQNGIYQSTPEGKFLMVNRFMAKMFGYDSPEDLLSGINDIGRQLFNEPADRLRMKTVLEKEGVIDGMEIRAQKKNGELVWVKAHIHTVTGHDGKTSYYEGILEDISRSRAVEEQLQAQFNELKKTNYELDRFVYSISHDLRAPLASILGLVNVAEMEFNGGSELCYFHMIRKSVTRLDNFVREILNYSRNARLDLNTQQIDFSALLNETTNDLQFIEGSSRLKTTLNIEGTASFYSDRLRLGILFDNLYSNAVKYQDPGKPEPVLHISVVISERQATIVFEDNGIGIEEQCLPRIFDMFYRASDRSTGSGLGLYIAKETVQKLGGSIDVASKHGEYTRFTLNIPSRS